MKQPIYRTSILLIYVLIVTACGDAVETVSQNNLDVKRPITTASPTARTYAGSELPVNVSLSCSDDVSGCNTTYYSTDPNEAKDTFSQYDYDQEVKIAIATTTTLRFYSTDYAGRIEDTKTAKYIIDHAPVIENSALNFTINNGIMDITWTPAVDPEPDPGTPQAALTYQLYFADTNVFTSLENTLNPALATAHGDWQVGSSAQIDTQIDIGAQNRYWQVLVKDAIGNISTYTAAQPANLPSTTSISVSNGSIITNSAEIVFLFDESMNAASLILSGSMGLASDGGTWSNNLSENDTLTIGPAEASLWVAGDATLIVSVTDIVGNPFNLDLNYTVDEILPQGTEQPNEGSSIEATTEIIVNFTESMKTGSENIGGNMVNTDGASTAWSNTGGLDNDTLIITPTSSWVIGNNTLTLSATDIAGNPFNKSMSYTIIETGLACSSNNDCPVELICSVIANMCILQSCGNDFVDTGEQCDGTDLGGQTCASLGLGNGTLSCSVDCISLDTSGCAP